MSDSQVPHFVSTALVWKPEQGWGCLWRKALSMLGVPHPLLHHAPGWLSAWMRLHSPQSVKTAWLAGVKSIWTTLYLPHWFLGGTWGFIGKFSSDQIVIPLLPKLLRGIWCWEGWHVVRGRLAAPISEDGCWCPLPLSHTGTLLELRGSLWGTENVEFSANSTCANNADFIDIYQTCCAQAGFSLPPGRKFITQSNRWMSSDCHINLQ